MVDATGLTGYFMGIIIQEESYIRILIVDMRVSDIAPSSHAAFDGGDVFKSGFYQHLRRTSAGVFVLSRAVGCNFIVSIEDGIGFFHFVYW